MNEERMNVDVHRLVRCLRCRAEIRDRDDCPECGEVWDASADTLPTPAQLHRWTQLYWVDTAKAQEIEKGLGICFAQEIRAIADVIEDRILSPNTQDQERGASSASTCSPPE